MKTTQKTFVLTAIGWAFCAAGNAESIIGTTVTGTISGERPELDTPWALCLGADQNVTWSIEGVHRRGTWLEVAQNSVCLFMENGISCFSYEISDKQVTLRYAAGERVGFISGTKENGC